MHNPLLTEVPPALRVRDVSKTYDSSDGTRTALAHTSFDIQQGEFVSLVGPSGCGKTTLLKLCTGLLAPSAGVAGYRDTGRPVPPGTYGIVFQNAALMSWRTVLANITLPRDILGGDRATANDRARELLDLVELAGIESKYPNELSGGMQQRVAIARALLHDPEILFMDEPFGALDALTRETLNMLLQQVHQSQRKTVLFVTHSISEAVLLSDRIIVMSAGPGRVVDNVPVELDRPRGHGSAKDPEFQRIVERVRAQLGVAA